MESLIAEGTVSWKDVFDERQLKDIAFCQVYAKNFGHGADGHNRMLVVAKMVEVILRLESGRDLTDLKPTTKE